MNVPSSGRLPILLLILVALLAFALLRRGHRPSPDPIETDLIGSSVSPEQMRRLVNEVSTLESHERELAETIWAPELLARRCGRLIDHWWDALNADTNRWLLLHDFPWPAIRLPVWPPLADRPHAIRVRECRPTVEGPVLSGEDWRAVLQNASLAGWALRRVELRHQTFSTNASGGPRSSRYAFSAWLEQPSLSRRATLQGEVLIEWSAEPLPDGTFAPRHLDASAVEWRERVGMVPFVEEYFAEVEPPQRSFFIDPILVHDLDRDGRPEIVLAAKNQVLRRTPDGSYTLSALCSQDVGLLFTAILADFDQDGAIDLLGVRAEGLILIRGAHDGTFGDEPRIVWRAPQPIRYGQVLTAADVDADGDLDVWLGQYKPPYERGQMPTPYYDANDGYPSYLLLNNGPTGFVDSTEQAGLAHKRHRRTYSASFADLNSDDAPDLVVVSDFAGVELHLNDGRGRFAEAREWFPDPLGFGMAHTFGDFDADGELDLLVTGMHCPSAIRLDSLGLLRPGFEILDAMRGRMTQGNRLYLRRDGGFAFTALGKSVAHSGWSWSPAAADYDNDGYLDLYVSNGHETHQSVVDYEPEFWQTDLYLASSADDLTRAAYFGAKFGRTRGQGQSYGGYEANRMYLSQGAQDFLEVGWLFGVAVEQDSRNAAPVDLDADGRVDLVVTTFEAWPRRRQTLRVFRNDLPHTGRWLGLRLDPSPGTHPFGARITVQAGERRFIRLITSGDLHRIQQPWSVTIGLGERENLDQLEVRWPDGRTTRMASPELDRYHAIADPAR